MTVQPQDEGQEDTYDLADNPAPAAPKTPPSDLGKAFGLDAGGPAAPAPSKSGKPGKPGAAPPPPSKEDPSGLPPPVDPAAAARRRADQRKLAAEQMAIEHAQAQKKKFIIFGVIGLIIAGVVVYFMFIK